VANENQLDGQWYGQFPQGDAYGEALSPRSYGWMTAPVQLSEQSFAVEVQSTTDLEKLVRESAPVRFLDLNFMDFVNAVRG
jgi:hypothetical protein